PNPTPTPAPGVSACSVTYMIQSQWQTGMVANVTVANNSANAINGWMLTWSFGGNQMITNLWNGMLTQTGHSVSVRNVGFNGNLTANGGSATFGFQASLTGTTTTPTNFALNGVPCTVR
ncbi:MAG TPA: cellulose binding domain-containing protein, partial [Blastocatellia bacterium]|nr:cellulose binding domain-containing protein [Blastocatellia bacterium]